MPNYCPRCGNALNGGSAFCPYCGTRLDNSKQLDPRSIQDVLNAALQPLKECDLSRARAAVERAERLDPNCSDAMYMEALMSTDNRKCQMFISMASSPSAKSAGIFTEEDIPKYRQAWMYAYPGLLTKAKECLRNDDRNTAARIIESLLVANPNCSDVWYMKAVLAEDPAWRRRYVMAAEGSKDSQAIFGPEDMGALTEGLINDLVFRWVDGTQGMTMHVSLDGKEVCVLGTENGFRGGIRARRGTHTLGAVMSKRDGTAVGNPLSITVEISGSREFVLKTGGTFKSKILLAEP